MNKLISPFFLYQFLKRKLFASLFIGLFHCITYAQTTDTLTKYFTPIPLQNPDSAWNVLKPALKGKKLFLFGESHGVGCNLKLQLSLFKYLHKYAGVRYLIWEKSPSAAYFYNLYLQTGKRGYLIHTGYMNYKEVRVFWNSLYEFNQGLPIQARIQVIGVDVPDEEDFTALLNLFFKRHSTQLQQLPNRIKIQAQLKKGKNINTKEAIALQRLLRQGLRKHPEQYQKIFGQDYWFLQYMVLNPWNDLESKRRDRQMAGNFKKVQQKFTNGNYMGIFGGAHVEPYRKNKNTRWFLQRDRENANQILAFQTQYYKVKSIYWQETRFFEHMGIFFEMEKWGINEEKIGDWLSRKAKEEVTLMPLKPLLEVFRLQNQLEDYLLFIQNQKAETFEQIKLDKRKD